MSAREIQDQKAITREIFVQQPAHGNADVSANPLRGATICSTKSRWDYALESTADEFCEAADKSWLPVIGVDAANLMRVLRQLEVIAKRQAPRIAFKAKGRILFLDLAEIVAVQAEGNYVSLRYPPNPYLLRESLSSMAEKLKPYGFIRIHRSVIVNVSAVEEIHPLPTGEYRLRVKGGKEYLVTRTYKNNLRDLGSTVGRLRAPLIFAKRRGRTMSKGRHSEAEMIGAVPFRSIAISCVLACFILAAWSQVPKPAPQVKTSEPAATSPNSTPEMTAADVGAFLDGLLPQQLKREDIAGAVVVVVKDGKILFSKGYGFADVKKRTPVSPEGTLFRPGSISKTFTWTAIMQLVEQGKINLDSDVNDYLDFQVPHTFGRPVTVRNLMTHTPGFEEVIKDSMVNRADQLPALQAFVIAHQPYQIFAPGTIPAYSNYGAELAGYIVQRVSGLPFEEYIQKNIFKPLGIAHGTFMEPLPDSLKPLMSNGYDVASDDPKPFELVPPLPAPDGSLSITGADMAPFMIAHLQNGKYGDVRILQEQTAQTMHSRQFGMDPAVNAMALGFYQENRNGLRIIGHGGDLNYMHSDMHLVVDKGVGFFVSYNSSGKGELDARTALWQAFLDHYFPFTEAGSPADPQQFKDSVEGRYLSSRRAQTTILRSLWWVLAEASVSQNPDGTIQVDSMKDFAGQPKKWRAIVQGQFREVNGQQLLVFKPDASGNMQMITEDPTEILQRVSWTENKRVLLVALGFAVLIFAFTLLLWPVAALIRRHYKRPLTLTPLQKKLRLFLKLACAIDLAALLAFTAVVAYGFSNLTVFSDALDPWLRVIQVIFVIGILATIGMLYSSYRLWQSVIGLWTSLYTAGLVLASIIFLWFVGVSRIVQGSLKY